MSFPTQLTVLRIILVPIFFLLFAVIEPAQLTWAAAIFLVAALSDWYDGYFARLLNLVTPLGAFLDPLADKLLTSAAFIAFAYRGLIPWWMVVVVLGRDIYLTAFRLRSDTLGMSIRTSVFAKIKTFVQMAFIGYVLLALTIASWHVGAGSQIAIAASASAILYWAMLGVTSLTFVSAIQYTYDNWRVFRAVSRNVFPSSTQGL